MDMSDLVDQMISWSLLGNPPPAPHPLKAAMIKSFVTRSGYSSFIETGTYEGTTTKQMAALGLNVITIELSKTLYEEAKVRLSEYPNVRCLHGDSGNIMPAILSELREPAVFWLDGHYSAGKTARGERITPLVEELFHILHHDIRDHIVLIDDVRVFDGVVYPTIGFIAEFFKLYLRDHRCDVLHDIFRARPSSLAE
jgi:hypothetical protein